MQGEEQEDGRNDLGAERHFYRFMGLKAHVAPDREADRIEVEADGWAM
jgi:hypothetical protein